MQLPSELQRMPLLVRTVDANNQEKLQICTGQVDAAGKVLKLVEQDGNGSVRNVPISTIASVQEDRSQAMKVGLDPERMDSVLDADD